MVNAQVYDQRSEEQRTYGASGSYDSNYITVISINPKLVKNQTVRTVETIVINGKAKASEIVHSGIKSLAHQIEQEIDRRITIIKTNLDKSVQERKSLGDNVLPEIEKLETNLDSTRQAITSLNEIYKFTENLQTNSIS